MNAKKLTIVLVLLGALAALVVGVGSAAAQDDQPPGRPGFDVLAAALDATAEATGLDESDILSQLGTGASLAEIVEANGGDPQAVIDAAAAAATEHINDALANGVISQERADRMLANVEDAITRAVNGELRPLHPGAGFWQRFPGQRMRQHIEGRVRLGVLNLAAEQAGLTFDEIREQLQSGTPLADILSANGVDVDAFVQDVLDRVDTRLKVLVVDGRITEERAGELLAQFQTKFEARIFSAQPTPEAAGAI